MRTLREKGLLGQVAMVTAFAAALLLRNLQVLCGLIAAASLAFLWSVLRRGNDQLRRDFADYPGASGAPLAWLISKLPASAPKVVCSLLAVGLFGFSVFGLLTLTTFPSGRLDRADLAARANSICATYFNFLADAGNALAQEGVVPDVQPAIDRRLKDIKGLTPAAGVAREWRRVVAGLVAQSRDVTLSRTAAQNAADTRAENKGAAAERRLNIHCLYVR